MFVALAGVGVWAQQRQARSAGAVRSGQRRLDAAAGELLREGVAGTSATRHLVVTPKGDIYTVLARRRAARGAADRSAAAGRDGLRDKNGDGKYETARKVRSRTAGNRHGAEQGQLSVCRVEHVGRPLQARWRRADAEGRPEVIVGDIPRAGRMPPSRSRLVRTASSSCTSGRPPTRARSRIAGQTSPARIRARRSTCMAASGSTTPAKPGQKHVRRGALHDRRAAHAGAGVNPVSASAVRRPERTRSARHAMAEELHRAGQREPAGRGNAPPQAGREFGWPYCFFDLAAKKRLLNPEYRR